MSSELTVRFGNDMPPAAVEVISPDFRTVARLMLDGGREAKVQVPSEGSFLRVHLPSGKVVTLTEERGQLHRFVSRATLDAAQGLSRPAERPRAAAGLKDLTSLRQYHLHRSLFRDAAPSEDTEAGESIPLGEGVTARVFAPGDMPMKGKLNSQGDEGTWEIGYGNLGIPPLRLAVTHPWGQLYALLPANTQTVYARTDQVREGEALLIGIRLASRQPAADTILNYLERGDLDSAESMLGWVEEAEHMLQSKMADPYAAAVGAYLLLQLRHFERLHTWSKNLADWFDFLPDGAVIWAWQLIHQDPSREAEIRHYLLQAAARGLPGATQGLPVYSRGLRLLMDGLSMLSDDPEARQASERVRRASGAVLWDSPVTAGSRLDRSSYARSNPVLYDVSYMASA